jgi:uncharacterized membrane protein
VDVEYEFVCRVDVRVLVMGMLGLMAFGAFYNHQVARLKEKGRDRGFMSLLVVLGVAVTGIGFALVVWSLPALLVLVGCFVASGIPMIVGSVNRYMEQRAEEEGKAKVDAWRVIPDD